MQRVRGTGGVKTRHYTGFASCRRPADTLQPFAPSPERRCSGNGYKEVKPGIRFLLSAAFIFSTTAIPAQDKSFAYLNHLVQKREYFDAAVETVRLGVYDKNIPAAEFDYIERSLRFKNADYRYVIRSDTGGNGMRETLLLSQSYFFLHNYNSAHAALDALPVRNTPSLLLVKTYQSLVLFDFREAANAAQLLKEQNSKYNALYEQISKYNCIKSRSPFFSAFLSSFVPGAGQLYSERYRDALLSLALTAGGGAGTYYLYKNNQRSWSYLTAFFTALFYAGNIIGGYHSAEKYNYENNTDFSQSIITKNSFYDPLDFADRKVIQ
jgi:hypothetical protein